MIVKTGWWFSLLRIGLGIVFVVASVTKLSAQHLFVNEVLSYDVLPDALAKAYAIVLPWAELLTGVTLTLAVFTTAGLVLSALMASSFAIANTCALARGTLDGCGSCFGQLIPLSLTAALAIDILMVAAAVLLLLRWKSASSLSIGDYLLTRVSAGLHDTPKRLIQQNGRPILLAVIALAVGLPLSLSGQASPIYHEIDGALKQGKLVLLYFYLEGCSDCAKQVPIIEDLESMYGDSVDFIYVDYRREAGLAGRFEVTFVPTTLLVVSKEGTDYSVSGRFHHYTSMLSLQRGLYKSPAAGIICDRYGPIADFTAEPTTGYVPIEVRFNDACLANVEWHWEFEWAWDFDSDGVVDSRVRNPALVYEKPGKYSVTLTLNGPCGSSSIAKTDYLLFVPNESLASQSCTIDFVAEPTSVDTYTPVKFFAQSEADIVFWKWDFDGDGTVDSNERDAVHTYTSPGSYSVSLTVESADCENRVIKQDYVKVITCLCG
jgi:PKD repeat protein